MNISVLTPDRQIFIGQISSASLPGVEGEFQVLDNHAALVSSLDGGKVKLVTSGEYRYLDEKIDFVVKNFHKSTLDLEGEGTSFTLCVCCGIC
ncbi:MAG: hypothetical protein AAFU67_13235, partial [Bacteroidota bacterium]